MTLPKKIALFYGHVASNIGDLAINSGTINLLRSVCSGVKIDVVFIDADASEFLDAAKSSFDDQGDIRFTYLKTHGEKTPLYLRSPETFFAEAGVSDADVVLLSAGEHLFSYQHEENSKSLFWRTFPAYAAKLAGKKCVQMCSTLGPFETERSSALLLSMLGLTDAFAVRDARSLQLLKTRYGTEKPLLLDPAFFLHSPVATHQAQKKQGATALVMRSEGWGIRLSNALRKEQTERFKVSGYEASKAFLFSLEFASRLLNSTDEVLRVFVQTTADQELADELGRRLPEFLKSGRLTIERPYSVPDYLSRLAGVDRIVSNRFHALILGMVVGRQTHGLYFDVHGHKIPGLFNLIEAPGRCHNLSNTEPRTAAVAVLDEVARETETQQKLVQKCVEKLRQDTVAWMNEVLQKATTTADARQLLTASVSLGALAEGQLKASIESKAKKQIDLAKNSAQTKEAQWKQERQQLESELSQATVAHQAALEELKVASADAQTKEAQWTQQRQQLEGALITATAEAQRLSAVNQAQLEALQLELPNSLSNKLGNALIECIRSPAAVAKLPFQLYKIWRESKSQQPLAALGGESFGEVISAYSNGGLDAVEKLLESFRLPSIVVANAYTALARHLKQTDAHQAAEAARRAYMADLKPFRRKWLAFKLSEAGKFVEGDVLLSTLPADTQFSASEKSAMTEISGWADDERQIAARAKVDEYLLEIVINTQTKSVVTHTESTQLSLARPDQYYVEKYRAEGVDAITNEIYRNYADKKKIGANECIRAAKALRDAGMLKAEYPLMKAAKELHTIPATLRSFFWAAQREKRFSEACNAIHEIETRFGATLSSDESQRLRVLKDSPSYQLTLRNLVVDRCPRIQKPISGRICYVLHNSLPYSSGGYATRSHGVASGLNKAGFDVIVLTRPGFPSDTKPEVVPESVLLSDVIDGVQYSRIPLPLRKSIRCPSGKTIIEYVPEAANEIEKRLRELNPQLVIAASNYFTGLPALIASRRLGIPFVYEVRGLWEITRMSRDPDFRDSATFAVQSMFEAFVCNEADRVLTLTGPMRDELVARSVDAAKIALLPNSCDPDRFLPRTRDISLAKNLNISSAVPVIGYIGTFVDYEGLEDLATACALLKQRGIEFRLLLVGNENASGQDRGPITEQITSITNSNEFNDWLIMPGRIPHEEVEKYYSLIDIAPFPRKPLPVCEMVSPMKPLEAFAMEKAVVVSSVRALEEMVEHEQTGLIFEKGNVESLANALVRLVMDTELRRTLGKNGRKWVTRQRTWVATTQVVTSYINELSHSMSGMSSQPSFPLWWQSVPVEFRKKSHFRNVPEWELSGGAKVLKNEYESRFGKDAVARKIPLTNWQRADICSQLIAKADPLDVLDVGSGLGEFVNLFKSTNPNVPIASVDVKDYTLWFDFTGRIERIYKSIFDLGPDEARDVVTCFEVIEHLPPERVEEAVGILRSLAKRKLFISVPFMEPLPLSTGHRSRFEDTNLLKLFPDAKFTIFGKGGKSANKVLAWIMCEIDCDAT